ncbi:MAG: glycosyltransferase family 2 protein [Magnetococcales bacterium]|nr:glycosyltransferase family 2 protein [Magnetococcales bacterium]
MTAQEGVNVVGDSGVPDISVVVPVYQEEENIRPFLARLLPVLQAIGRYEVIFCLDPCRDRSEAVIREAMAEDPRIALLVFSRRFGQPAATMAGIFNCRGATCVVIDVDLQDPPEVIARMYRALTDGGVDVVVAQRASRRGETLLKRVVSYLGYKVINRISEIEIPRNTGDFRIISRRVIEALRGLNEGHGFLRGLVSFVGYSQQAIVYDRDERAAGRGKYNPFTGSFKIGLNGVFGFSTFPLSFLLWSGLVLFLISLLAIPVMFYNKLVLGQNYPMGIPTITVLVLFMGGIQLMSVGILGQYIGRIYDEVRRRPQYIIEKAVNLPVRDDGSSTFGRLNR